MCMHCAQVASQPFVAYVQSLITSAYPRFSPFAVFSVKKLSDDAELLTTKFGFGFYMELTSSLN